MDIVKAEPTRQPIRFRGRSYVAFVFSPAAPIVGWLELLDTTLARSPGFFVGKPVVLDLSALDLSAGAAYALPQYTGGGAGFGGSPMATMTEGGEQIGDPLSTAATGHPTLCTRWRGVKLKIESNARESRRKREYSSVA